MCWHCCTSLRGAVYFLASIHIFLALVFVVLLGFYYYYLPLFVDDNFFTDATVAITTILLTIYSILFLVFSLLIFRGVEKASLTVLKFSTAGFSIVQLSFFIVILVLYFILPELERPLQLQDEQFHPLLKIILLSFAFVATVNYIIILILYLRKLWKLKTQIKNELQNKQGRNSILIVPEDSPGNESTGVIRSASPPPRNFYPVNEPIYSGSIYRTTFPSQSRPETMSTNSHSTVPVAYYRNPRVSGGYNVDPQSHQPFLSQTTTDVDNSSQYPLYRNQQHPHHHPYLDHSQHHHPTMRSNAPSEYGGDRNNDNSNNWDLSRIQFLPSSSGIYSGGSVSNNQT